MTRRPKKKRRSAVENAFIDEALAYCREYGYAVEFRDVERLGPVYHVGFFSEYDRRLVVATGTDRWFETFVHEFAHLQQAVEGLWMSPEEMQSWDLFEGWIKGKNVKQKRLERAVRTIQACERDAERRTASFARRYGFPSMDVPAFIKRANLYILSYEAALRTRKSHDRPLYLCRKLMKSVPSSFVRRLDKLPDGYLDRYLERC